MKPSDYTQLAMRTAPVSGTIGYEIATGHPTTIDIFHACLGIVGEISELIEIDVEFKHAKLYDHTRDERFKLVEELGDLMWYCALANRAVSGIRFEHTATIHEENDNHFTDMAHQAGVIADKLKRHCMYRANLDMTAIRDAVNAIVFAAYRYCQRHDLSWTTVLEKNIAKLKQRYPGNYSHEQAINRDVAAERKVLEG